MAAQPRIDPDARSPEEHEPELDLRPLAERFEDRVQQMRDLLNRLPWDKDARAEILFGISLNGIRLSRLAYLIGQKERERT